MSMDLEGRYACGAAAFGGVATSLFPLAVELTHGKGLPNASFLVGLAILAAMGGLVALLFGETNYRKAFFLGLSLPSLIQVGADSVSNTADVAPGQTQVGFRLLPVAYAQAPEQPAAGRTLKIVAAPGMPAYEVVFVSADGKQQEKVSLDAGTAEKVIRVPDYGSRFEVRVGGSRSESQPLGSAGTTVANVSTQENTWSGLQRSLGVKHADRYEVSVKVQSR